MIFIYNRLIFTIFFYIFFSFVFWFFFCDNFVPKKIDFHHLKTFFSKFIFIFFNDSSMITFIFAFQYYCRHCFCRFVASCLWNGKIVSVHVVFTWNNVACVSHRPPYSLFTGVGKTSVVLRYVQGERVVCCALECCFSLDLWNFGSLTFSRIDCVCVCVCDRRVLSRSTKYHWCIVYDKTNVTHWFIIVWNFIIMVLVFRKKIWKIWFFSLFRFFFSSIQSIFVLCCISVWNELKIFGFVCKGFWMIGKLNCKFGIQQDKKGFFFFFFFIFFFFFFFFFFCFKTF